MSKKQNRSKPQKNVENNNRGCETRLKAGSPSLFAVPPVVSSLKYPFDILASAVEDIRALPSLFSRRAHRKTVFFVSGDRLPRRPQQKEKGSVKKPLQKPLRCAKMKKLSERRLKNAKNGRSSQN